MEVIRQISFCTIVLMACLTVGRGQDAHWQVGERFIFQPGYGLDYSVLDIPPLASRLPYSRYAGTTATVLSVEKGNCGADVGLTIPCLIARMTADADGTKFAVQASSVLNLGLVRSAPLEVLSEKFKGKTLWFRHLALETPDAGRIVLSSYVPVTIIDVQISDNRIYPARFIFQTSSGQKASVDKRLDQPFINDFFFTRDPRQIFPSDVWSYIERGKVRLGMTEEQAVASWGRPDSINRTRTRRAVSEQWVYDGWYLYFTNGRLTAVQD